MIIFVLGGIQNKRISLLFHSKCFYLSPTFVYCCGFSDVSDVSEEVNELFLAMINGYEFGSALITHSLDLMQFYCRNLEIFHNKIPTFVL